MSDHATEDVLRRFLEEALGEAERAEVERHVGSCPSCQEVLDRLALGPGDDGPESRPPAGPAPGGRDREILQKVGDNPPPSPTSGQGPAGRADGEPISFPGPHDDRGPLGRLLHYNILTELGGGTYGVVFKAYDPKLALTVAIKVLRPELARLAGLRERFQREARAVSAAAVENHHVVTIHLVADDAPGFPQPFIVMEFVDGEPLRDVEGFREAARITREVALGLTAAHGRGVVHRDIKPENILIARSNGQARLVDFGIAYVLERAIQRSGRGSIVGTPAYMSREAFVAPDRVDGCSDVYSLGVVLYQLLTGVLPFDGESAAELQRRVVFADPTPPRALDHRIPADLEAVVLKCLEKPKERRYQTAAELVEDLGRFLRGEPVRARGHSAPETFWMWCRRQPWLAATAAAAALLMVAVTVVSTTSAVVIRDKNVRLARAGETARDRAELAIQATEQFYRGVGTDEILRRPQYRSLRKQLLKSPLEFYQRLVAAIESSHDQDARTRFTLAKAYSALGYLNQELGDEQDAIRAYRQALALHGALAREYPERPEYQGELVATLNNLGNLFQITGQWEAAMESFRGALGRANAGAPPISLAHTYVNLGALQHATGDFDGARASYKSALTIYRGLGDASDARRGLADCLDNLGSLHDETGALVEARRCYDEARSHYEWLRRLRPEDPKYRDGLASAYNNLGVLQRRVGQIPDAEASYRKALDIRREVAVENPNVGEYQHWLARSLTNMASLEESLGRIEQSGHWHEEARGILAQLVRDHPDVLAYRADLAACDLSEGSRGHDSGRLDQALANYRQYIEAVERLDREHPAIPSYRADLATGYSNLGLVYHRLGRTDDALEAYGAARRLCESLARDHPTVLEYQQKLGECDVNIGGVCAISRRFDEAFAALRRARDRYKGLVRHHPMVTDYKIRMATIYINLSVAQGESGSAREAVASGEEARTILDAVLRANPNAIETRIHLAGNLSNLGDAYANLGRFVEAEEAYRRAVACQREVLGKDPASMTARRFLVNHLLDLALVQRTTGRLGEALGSVREVQAVLNASSVSPYDRELRANALRELGILQYMQGLASDAEASFGESRRLYETLIRDFPAGGPAREFPDFGRPSLPAVDSEPVVRSGLAFTEINTGVLLRDRGRPEEASAAFVRARDLFERLTVRKAANWSTKEGLARSLLQLANLDLDRGRPDEARASLVKARAVLADLLREAPAIDSCQEVLALVENASGALELSCGNPAGAEEAYQKARGVYRGLIERQPRVPVYGNGLAWNSMGLGKIRNEAGRPAAALPFFQEAVRLAEAILQVSPEDRENRALLGGALTNLGGALANTGRPGEALDAYGRARDLLEGLVRAGPGNAAHQSSLGAVLNNIGTERAKAGRWGDAESAYRQAIDHQRVAFEADKGVSQFREFLCTHYGNLGQVLAATRRPAEALAAQQEALSLMRSLSANYPDNPAYRVATADREEGIGQIHLANGDSIRAVESFQRACALYESLVSKYPGPGRYPRGLANELNLMGLAQSNLGRDADAIATYGRAVALLKGNLQADDDDTASRVALGGVNHNLANTYLKLRRLADAEASFREALRHQRQAFHRDPASATCRRYLSNHLTGLGYLLRATGRPAEAASLARERLGLWPADPGEAYNVACELSLCAAAAGRGNGEPAATSRSGSDPLADEAMVVLREAVRRGFRNLNHMRGDPDLRPLRSRADFRSLLMDVAFPTDPFASRTPASGGNRSHN
jgi:tetratricopeptide (TPR) repeat protein